ncbi:MAG: TRAP transporter TatT component family protein [Candidatus Latescibacterota bacterium]|jgi:hypothetical protein
MIKVACIPVFRVTTSLALALAAGAVALGTACSPTKYAVGSVMVPVLDNARVAAFSSEDVKTFRDAAPSNLFLLEGLIETDPDKRELRINAAMLYFAYAFAFQEDADPSYASLLYRTGMEHGYAALAMNKKMPRDPEVSFDEFEASLPQMKKKDVPAAVWTAVNWAQFISLHLDSTGVLRDIPKVTALLDRVAELDPQYFEGLPYTMLGVLHSFKPPIMGGDPAASLENFEKGFAVSGESFLLSKYLFARFYTYRIMDDELFEETLEGVLSAKLAPDDPYKLLNIIAKQRSRILLGEIDELF